MRFSLNASLPVAQWVLDVSATLERPFNVMARNCDDHTKNFSFQLNQGEEWELAPAYNLTHAYNPKGEWTYQHLTSVNGQFREITRDEYGSTNSNLARKRYSMAELYATLSEFGCFRPKVTPIGPQKSVLGENPRKLAAGGHQRDRLRLLRRVLSE